MDLQQVKRDLDSNVLISDSTWKKVLDTALEQASAQDALVNALTLLAQKIEANGLAIAYRDELQHAHAAIDAVGAA